MESALEMAGLFAAHAVWSVSDGAVLIPIIGAADNKRQMIRLATERVERLGLRVSSIKASPLRRL